MTTTTAILTTARKAGLSYLILAISGLIGFLLIRSSLLEPGDAAATTDNLLANVGLARIAIAAELTIVGAQAVAALYFFRLFKPVDWFAAASLAAFGFINSAVLLFAAAFSATAVTVATSGGSVNTTYLMYQLNGSAWEVGALFFGLWLIPMGRLTLRAGMPRALGWFLITGGVGYVLSAYLNVLAPDATALAEAIVWPATIGEFWMIGYLLTKGGQLDPAYTTTAAQVRPTKVGA
ncbi:MAG: DUF4386 domain-containing protein [Acidimicrobiia bacterium]|nr:DUF4386 domain-containing protein [Acidimicrobiia bacterium]MDH5502538.1 DUF4386 domain-containing protein [Acidimicrobiia bacterium]